MLVFYNKKIRTLTAVALKLHLYLIVKCEILDQKQMLNDKILILASICTLRNSIHPLNTTLLVLFFSPPPKTKKNLSTCSPAKFSGLLFGTCQHKIIWHVWLGLAVQKFRPWGWNTTQTTKLSYYLNKTFCSW